MNTEEKYTVAVLGASPKPERYANKAVRLLLEHEFKVVPVNPAYEAIEAQPAVPDLSVLEPGSIDTVTVYMRPERTVDLAGAIVSLGPRRVIFNPGTESEALMTALKKEGIEVVEACTLVLLNTGQF